MKSTCSVGVVCVALVCLLAGPAWGEFSISGGGGGFGLEIITSDVPDPGSFLVKGTSPLDDTDVEFYLYGTDDGGDPSVNWTNEMTFRADVSTGEIGVEMLTHTGTLVGGPDRSGPYALMDGWMSDVFHVDPGGGFGLGDPVEFDFISTWTGHILLEGVPHNGCHVGYTSRLNNA